MDVTSDMLFALLIAYGRQFPR